MNREKMQKLRGYANEARLAKIHAFVIADLIDALLEDDAAPVAATPREAELEAQLVQEREASARDREGAKEAMSVLHEIIDEVSRRRVLYVLLDAGGTPVGVSFERKDVELLIDAGVHRVVRATIDQDPAS